MHPAKAARLSKEKYPEHYCPVNGCLWRTYNGQKNTYSPCGKHGAFVVCRWFAFCENPATHNESHPIRGGVPCCDRCAKIGA